MIRVVFVCLGNICRSPTAEGVMRHLARGAGMLEQLHLDSAGTLDEHVGQTPDPRTLLAARRRGIVLEHRARQFAVDDFARFDYVVAMDRQNRRDLLSLAPDPAATARIHLLRAFDPLAPAEAEVPDPYFGGPQGFDTVLDICEAACRGLLEALRARHQLETGARGRG